MEMSLSLEGMDEGIWEKCSLNSDKRLTAGDVRQQSNVQVSRLIILVHLLFSVGCLMF